MTDSDEENRFEHRHCPVCACTKSSQLMEVNAGSFNRLIQNIERAKIDVCQDCGMHFTNPVLNSDLDEEQYTHEKSGYNKRAINKIEDIYWTDQRLCAKVIESICPDRDAKILDFACGKGGLVYLLNQRGYRPKGIDLNQNGIEIGRKFGVTDIHYSNLFDEPDHFYDVVAALHVLEHCKDCVLICEKLASILRSRGHLLVAVPNFGSRTFQKNPEKYWNSPYAHMNAFDIGALDRLMGDSGLQRVRLKGNDFQTGFKNWLSMLITKWSGNLFSYFPTKLIAVYQKADT